MKNTKFEIVGMSCNGCVNGLKKALSAVDGVKQVDIELATGRASIDYDETMLVDDDLVEVVENAGFDVKN